MAKEKRLKIALIGYGAISQMLFDVFRDKKPPIDIVGVLVRKGRVAATQKKLGKKVAVVDDLKALIGPPGEAEPLPPLPHRQIGVPVVLEPRGQLGDDVGVLHGVGHGVPPGARRISPPARRDRRRW